MTKKRPIDTKAIKKLPDSTLRQNNGVGVRIDTECECVPQHFQLSARPLCCHFYERGFPEGVKLDHLLNATFNPRSRSSTIIALAGSNCPFAPCNTNSNISVECPRANHCSIQLSLLRCVTNLGSNR